MEWVDRARLHGVLADPHRLALLHHVALGDRSPKELSALLDIPMPLLSHHLKTLEDAELIARSVSEHDRRQRFVRLQHAAFQFLDAGWLRAQVGAGRSRVVFACTHNSARSVLASAVWSRRTRLPTAAGGTEPGTRIHPTTLRTARRHQLELLQTAPVALDQVLQQSDLLVTVCDAANASAPAHPHRLHWSIPDPARSGDMADFESAFSDITERIDRLGLALTQHAEKEQG
ncbi:MAG: helix-turn-helix domain-containing protein [Candidatus Nanopelagicales bacterium]